MARFCRGAQHFLSRRAVVGTCSLRGRVLAEKKCGARHQELRHPRNMVDLVSSERGELRGSGGTDTDLTVANRLVGHGELGEVVANHIGLHLDRVPVLATIALDDGVAHLGDDDAVAEVRPDGLGLLTDRHVLLGDAELLDEALVLRLDAAAEASALPGVHEGNDLLGLQFEELVELVATVNLLLERLLLRLC